LRLSSSPFDVIFLPPVALDNLLSRIWIKVKSLKLLGDAVATVKILVAFTGNLRLRTISDMTSLEYLRVGSVRRAMAVRCLAVNYWATFRTAGVIVMTDVMYNIVVLNRAASARHVYLREQ
jgi:hypothetical protein